MLLRKQSEQRRRKERGAFRWRQILPCLKRMYALGDDQMAEAKDKQQKEKSNKVVKIEGRRVEREREGETQGEKSWEWNE